MEESFKDQIAKKQESLKKTAKKKKTAPKERTFDAAMAKPPKKEPKERVFAAKKAAPKAEAPPPLDEGVIETLNDQDVGSILDYLIERINNEKTTLIIEKAKADYQSLAKRITEPEARKLVGKLLSEAIESRLLAVKATTR